MWKIKIIEVPKNDIEHSFSRELDDYELFSVLRDQNTGNFLVCFKQNYRENEYINI